MQEYRIRLMREDDYDRVYELWSVTEGMALRSYDDSAEGIAKFLKKNPNSNFVAEMGDEIVGVIMCGMDGRRAYIYHTVVRKDLRQQGIGKSLLRAVYHAIEAEGIKKNGLLVLKDNEIGNTFWRMQGWTERVDLNYYSKNND
ncbi:MAG: GNAT family N-acetyltransferase [Bacteroidales bacterium]|nr:GNAT family N-acetyltransferase [Bacteroidales bacterium]MDY6347010.1 GNAT family N-acetyltransferase [Bacteroidales bacterium]